MLHLIPTPKKLSDTGKSFPLYELENLLLPAGTPVSILQSAVNLADDFEKVTTRRLRFGYSGLPGKSIRLSFKADGKTDGYTLKSADGEIEILGDSEAGLFYGIQTLRQIFISCDNFCPELTINDEPDFPVRGFYHDITRGAVPTLESLFRLADKMAYYKLNQLQLYIEHTFAFARHCDIWEGGDPITAEEIIRLDHYCRERHIDLVPSLSTFGHFYMALRSKRKEELNELDIKASELPFSFYGRMAHYTLNCSDPRSLALVEEMLQEFMPLFTSKYFNICCDETFDLGKGKNAGTAEKYGTEKLYVDFLKKIIAIVEKAGRTAMFWGDIIATQPELIKTLPPGTIALEWDYGAEANYRDTATLAKTTENFYICPGTTVWNCWNADINVCQPNILNYARKGKLYGAKGLLNTNWGDMGNVNLFANSLYGLAYGAQASWNCDAAENVAQFDEDFDRMEFGCSGLSELWRQFDEAKVIRWKMIQNFVDPEFNSYQQENFDALTIGQVKDAISKLEDIFALVMKKFAGAVPADPLAVKESVFGFEMAILMHKTGLSFMENERQAAWETADALRKLEQRYSPLWHNRFKPSEYYRNREVLLKIAHKRDAAGR